MDQNILAIDTHGLSKSYKEVAALRSLDLKVARNSIFGFLGPNGAGKTTTIKLLLGPHASYGRKRQRIRQGYRQRERLIYVEKQGTWPKIQPTTIT